MKTVSEWIDFLKADNYMFGLQAKNGNKCKQYFTADEAYKEFDGWLDEKVIEAFPMNFIKDDKIYCLLVYNF